MATQLKFYYDLMSQPCRAVYMFLKINGIEHEAKEIALRKGEHMTPEYSKINPFQRVPVIDDGGFVLTESVAMMKYLCDKNRGGSIAEHWYPSNLQQRARVDEYMAWQHMNTRLFGAMVFRVQVIEPRMWNIPIDHEKLRRYKAQLATTVEQMETVFLANRQYLCGDDISIADLLGVCELMQPLATGHNPCEGHEKLTAWMERVKRRLQPHFDDAHKIVFRVQERFLEGKL